MRPPDEIVAIEATIQIPGGELTKERFLRAGHIYVLQIGSGENCQVRNECLANLHASIEVHKQSAYITNHDRVVGTLVNGQRIHDRIKVRHGDEVKCGDLVLDIEFLHPNLEGEAALPDPKIKAAYHCNGCGGEWLLHPKDCTNRAHWDSHVGKLGESLVEQKRREEEKGVEIESLSTQAAKLRHEVEVQKANAEKFEIDINALRTERRTQEILLNAVIKISANALEGVTVHKATDAPTWAKILANQYRKVKAELDALISVSGIAKDLPAPRHLSDEELTALNKEGRRLANEMNAQGDKIERVTSEDLPARVKSETKNEDG